MIAVDLLEGVEASGGSESPAVRITDQAVDRIRAELGNNGRPRVLLLDDDGRLATSVYAIHLVVDEGVDAATALSAARSTGLTESCQAFVAAQVARILEGR